MARIRRIGELEFWQQITIHSPTIDEETGEILEQGEWVIVCKLRLDNPIRIDQPFLDYLAGPFKRNGQKFDFHNADFTDVNIWRGHILDPNSEARASLLTQLGRDEFEKDPNNTMESIGFLATKKFLPKELLRAILRQKSYDTILMGLYPDIKRPASEHLCDVQLQIVMNEEVKNTDRFLQAFARKLNKWLVEARKSAV